MRRIVRPGIVALAVVVSGLFNPAQAQPVCGSTPWGTTCADPTGTCLVANYPKVGPATCLRNPIG